MISPTDKLIKQRALWLTLLIVLILLIDQALKIWVKTTFYLGESRDITSWFSLTFVENNGMAFGWSLGNKLFLSLFRIIFVGLLLWGLIKALKTANRFKVGFLVCLALIFTGAVGNIIDCVFYGEIFNNPAPPQTAQFVAFGQGYVGWFQGRVVDMLSFHLFSFDWPAWMPFVGGERFDFFAPIFNIADAAISVGVIALVLFYSRSISGFLELYKGKKAKNAGALAEEECVDNSK